MQKSIAACLGQNMPLSSKGESPESVCRVVYSESGKHKGFRSDLGHKWRQLH